MPEGHSLRRLALAFEQWFVGSICHTSSPQGRFVGGAAALDGMTMTEAQSVGKHLFLRFSSTADSGEDESLGGSAGTGGAAYSSDVASTGGAAGTGTFRGSEGLARPVHFNQTLWLHVHLGLYGSWRFYGTPSTKITPSIGAPRLPDTHHADVRLPNGRFSGDEGFGVTSRNGEVPALDMEERTESLGEPGPDDSKDVGDSGGDAFQMIRVAAQVGPDSNEGVRLDPNFANTANVEDNGHPVPQPAQFGEGSVWTPPPPRGAVRLRIVTDTVAADLSGPTQCEVLDAAGVEEVLERLGPDPLDHETSPELLRAEFVERVRASRRTIGELVMDQKISAGVGNIYRAEALFRQGISPHRKGANVSALRLEKLWDDFVFLLNEGVTSGRIRTIDPSLVSDQVDAEDPEAKKWFVYKRAGYQCLVCGAPVRSQTLGGRNLFWCSSCQK